MWTWWSNVDMKWLSNHVLGLHLFQSGIVPHLQSQRQASNDDKGDQRYDVAQYA
jgi:hypothetical protein